MAQATSTPAPAFYNGLSPVAKAALAAGKLRKAAPPSWPSQPWGGARLAALRGALETNAAGLGWVFYFGL